MKRNDKNEWCYNASLDPYSIKYRVRRWFNNNCVPGGGYNHEDQEDELMMLLIDTPKWYTNHTINQCIDWLKGTYNVESDKATIHHILIDLTIRYTSILDTLKKSSIELNEYVRKYYL